MKQHVIIIGGGIAGLCAGVYALRCGFRATILESHSIAGGNCTSWKRGGYLFEGGMHWLTGSHPGEPLHKLWRTVGALDDSVTIHTGEPFIEYDHKGTPVRIYRDTDKTEQHLLALSPVDEEAIKDLCSNMRKLRKLAMPVNDLRGVKVTKKRPPPFKLLLPAISAFILMRKFSNVSRNDYINRFRHEGIRELLRSSTSEETGVAPIFFTMGILSRGDGGFPEGGSLPFAGRIVKQFKSLGGELLLNTRAKRVIIENGAAKGVAIENSEAALDADAVIITADTMQMDHLFESPPQASWLDEMRKNTQGTMVTFICLGVNADLRKYQSGLVFQCAEPIKLADQSYDFLSINNYANNPVYSPAGKAALTIQLGGDTYDYWKKAKAEGRYAEEKQDIADKVIAELARMIPESAGNIEVIDVATPLTYERYCGNWRGSWMTEMTSGMKLKSYPAVIKHLKGVYFAGHRMMPPGGYPPAIMSGRAAVQHLCKDTGAVFVSESD